MVKTKKYIITTIIKKKKKKKKFYNFNKEQLAKIKNNQ